MTDAPRNKVFDDIRRVLIVVRSPCHRKELIHQAAKFGRMSIECGFSETANLKQRSHSQRWPASGTQMRNATSGSENARDQTECACGFIVHFDDLRTDRAHFPSPAPSYASVVCHWPASACRVNAA